MLVFVSIQHFYQPKALLCAFVRWHCAGFKCLVLQCHSLAALQQEIWASGFFLFADSPGFICSVNFQVAALCLHLEDLMSSNKAVVGDHSVELGLFWACPGPQAQLFLKVLVCTHKNPTTGTVGELLTGCGRVGWDGQGTTPSLVLPPQCDENSTFNNHALYLGLPCCKEDYNGCPNIPSSLIFQRSTKETFSVSTQLSSTKLTQNGELLIPQNCPRALFSQHVIAFPTTSLYIQL